MFGRQKAVVEYYLNLLVSSNGFDTEVGFNFDNYLMPQVVKQNGFA